MNLYSSVVMQVIGLTDEAICDVVKGRSGIPLMKGRTGAGKWGLCLSRDDLYFLYFLSDIVVGLVVVISRSNITCLNDFSM
jgi:hypothetical protein